jgi:hypothetical protein
MNKDKLKEIVKLIQEVNKELELKIKDSELLDFSIRVYNSENIKQEINPNEKPTDKQLSILKKSNIIIPDGLTRNEASILVGEIFKNKKEGVEY